MTELEQAVDSVQRNPNLKAAVLISGKPGCFIAGADIGMLAACKTYEEVRQISYDGKKILDRVENSTKPIVAAIMGSCLGGGLEVSLLLFLVTLFSAYLRLIIMINE